MEGQNELKRSMRTQREHSLVFKLDVVAEVEQGGIAWRDTQRKYGMQGNPTVLIWFRKHADRIGGGAFQWYVRIDKRFVNDDVEMFFEKKS